MRRKQTNGRRNLHSKLQGKTLRLTVNFVYPKRETSLAGSVRTLQSKRSRKNFDEPSSKKGHLNPSTVFIYTLSDPRTGIVYYVGKTISMQRRFGTHIYHSSRTSRKVKWISSLKAVGILPVMETLEVLEGQDTRQWALAEKFWIESLRFLGCPLTNEKKGGGGNTEIGYRPDLDYKPANRNSELRSLSILILVTKTEKEILRRKYRKGALSRKVRSLLGLDD